MHPSVVMGPKITPFGFAFFKLLHGWLVLVAFNAFTVFAQSGPAPASLGNLAIRAEAGDGARVLTTGFVIGGTGAKTLLVRGAGPALATFGVGQPLAAPLLTLYNQAGRSIGTNAGWSIGGDASGLRDAAQRVGAFSFRNDSSDAALLVTLTPGAYTAQVTDRGTAGGVALLEIYDTDESPSTSSRLVNLSARCFVGSGQSIAIPGIRGHGNRALRLLIRAVGPGLTGFGVREFLARPKIEVIGPSFIVGTTFPMIIPGSTVVENAGWQQPAVVTAAGAALTPGAPQEIRAVAAAVAAFPLEEGSVDAAVLVTMSPNAFTFRISGADGGTGVILIEVYNVSDF